MSEKLDKLRATLKKEQERRIKLNNRIAVLERRIQEEEAVKIRKALWLPEIRIIFPIPFRTGMKAESVTPSPGKIL